MSGAFTCTSQLRQQHRIYLVLGSQTLIFISLSFRTPNICRSILESSPCTPTPFKSQEAKYGLKLLVRKEHTPHPPTLAPPSAPERAFLTGGPNSFDLLQNLPPAQQQIAESIKQEPMECVIEQPPLKKIKQEVLSSTLRRKRDQMWNTLSVVVARAGSFWGFF